MCRLLKTLSADADSCDLSKQCLYLSFPSIQLHTLVGQILAGQVQLKGTFDKGTISDRTHLSAYISGGKRRVSRADNGVACTIRTANHLIARSMSHRKQQQQKKTASRSVNNWIGFVPWRRSDAIC